MRPSRPKNTRACKPALFVTLVCALAVIQPAVIAAARPYAAKAQIAGVNSNMSLLSVTGRTAHFLPWSASYTGSPGVKSLDLIDGSVRDAPSFGEPADFSDGIELKSSEFGAAVAGRSKTSSFYKVWVVPNVGVPRLLTSLKPEPREHCDRRLELIDIDETGRTTILIKRFKKATSKKDWLAYGECIVEPRRTKLYRFSPDGQMTRLWLPRSLVSGLQFGSVQIAGDIAAVSHPGGRRHDLPGRATLLDMARRRVIREFRSARPYDTVNLALGGNGSYAVSFVTHPSRRSRRHPRTSLFYSRAANIAPRRIWRRSDYSVPVICGDKIALYRSPDGDGFFSNAVSILTARGGEFTRRKMRAGYEIVYIACDSDFAVFVSEPIGMVLENRDPSYIWDGPNVIDLHDDGLGDDLVGV